MTRRTRHVKWAGASVVIAIALAAPAAAQAGSRAEASPASVARGTVPAGKPRAASRRTPRRGRAGSTGGTRRSRSRSFAGVLLMGRWGYAVVGALIAVATALLGAGARLVTGKPKPARGWSDWPEAGDRWCQPARGERRAKSSAISSNVAQRTPSCPLMCSMIRSCIASTAGRPLTSGWMVIVKTA